MRSRAGPRHCIDQRKPRERIWEGAALHSTQHAQRSRWMDGWTDGRRMASSSDKDSPHSLPGPAPELQRQLCVPAALQAPIPMPFGCCSFDRPPSRQWAPSSISPPSPPLDRFPAQACRRSPPLPSVPHAVQIISCLLVHLKFPSGEICRNEKIQITSVLKTKFRRLLS